MPCNYSGYFDTQLTKQFGVVDYDWSNAKALWANAQPMDCEERLVEQVRLTKEANPATKVWVYRNLVKALPWYTSVWTKLADPAYAGWFLNFSGANNYHVPDCDNTYDPPLCSTHYHDHDRTPGHPRGDGDCIEKCDCGGVPCGEYLWDHRLVCTALFAIPLHAQESFACMNNFCHTNSPISFSFYRNASLRAYLINEFVLGKNGLSNENVSGMFFDDGWTDSPATVLPWEPKEGFCDHSPIGGPTEENFFCTADMGLKQADTTAITSAYRETFNLVQQTVIGAGAFAWQFMRQTTAPVGANESVCTAWVREWQDAASGAYMQEWSQPTQRPLPHVETDLAAFLLVRGPYAWIGYGALFPV